MDTYTPKTVTLEEAVEEAVETAPRSLWQRITAGIVVAAVYAVTVLGGVSGCGNGGNGPVPDGSTRPDAGLVDSGVDSGNGVNALNPIDTSLLLPANGGSVSASDSPLSASFKLPGANPSYEGTPAGTADGKITATGDNATPSNTADDWTKTVVEKNGASLESTVNGSLDLATANNGGALKDGEKVTFDYTATTHVDGETFTREASSTVTYSGSVNPVRVTGCYVYGSVLGLSLAMQCNGESDNGPITGWGLTGGPDGSIITSTGAIGAPTMEASDVGLHTYNVTCTDGAATSDTYTFTVPVDVHSSRLDLHCQGGNTENLYLPETSVDAVATACGSGFNPANKPDSSAEPIYVLDVTPSCVQGAINALTAEEKEAHEHYNNGKTVADVYSSCTVDFAQVRYMSNN